MFFCSEPDCCRTEVCDTCSSVWNSLVASGRVSIKHLDTLMSHVTSCAHHRRFSVVNETFLFVKQSDEGKFVFFTVLKNDQCND